MKDTDHYCDFDLLTPKEASLGLLLFFHQGANGKIDPTDLTDSGIAMMLGLDKTVISHTRNKHNPRSIPPKYFDTAADLLGVTRSELNRSVAEAYFASVQTGRLRDASSTLVHSLVDNAPDGSSPYRYAAETLGIDEDRAVAISHGRGDSLSYAQIEQYRKRCRTERETFYRRLFNAHKLREGLSPADYAAPDQPLTLPNAAAQMLDWASFYHKPSKNIGRYGARFIDDSIMIRDFFRKLDEAVRGLTPYVLQATLLVEFGRIKTIINLARPKGSTTRHNFRARYKVISQVSSRGIPDSINARVTELWAASRSPKRLLRYCVQSNSPIKDDLGNFSGMHGPPKNTELNLIKVYTDQEGFVDHEGDMRATLLVMSEQKAAFDAETKLFWSAAATACSMVWRRALSVNLNSFKLTAGSNHIRYIDTLPHNYVYRENEFGRLAVCREVVRLQERVYRFVTDKLKYSDSHSLYATEVWAYDFGCDRFLQLSKEWSQVWNIEKTAATTVEVGTGSDVDVRRLSDVYDEYRSNAETYQPKPYRKTQCVVALQRGFAVSSPDQTPDSAATPELQALDVGTYIQIPVFINDPVVSRKLFGTVTLRFLSFLRNHGELLRDCLKEFSPQRADIEPLAEGNCPVEIV